MSLLELSGVTVLVGMFLTDQSDVQMTRRISKIFLHRQYNAATYVSCYNRTKIFWISIHLFLL
jgi:hypothetical protein